MVCVLIASILTACGGESSSSDDTADTEDEAEDAAPDGASDESDVEDVDGGPDSDAPDEDADATGETEDARVPVDGFVEADGAHEVVDAVSDAPDGGECTAAYGGVCNPVDQCGCAEGDRCVLDMSTDPPVEMCVAEGTDPFGTSCMGPLDNCALGSQCFDYRTWEGALDVGCLEFCYDLYDCPSGASCNCSPTGERADDEEPYHLCCIWWGSDDCDLFTGEGCEPDEHCEWNGPGSTLCDSHSDACWDDCPVGSGCFRSASGDMLCRRYCMLDGTEPDCSPVPGSVCSAALGDPVVGLCQPAG